MGVVLVFDVTSLQSFENVSFWLESLALHAGQDVSKIIVGNKVDLTDSRQVTRRRAESLAAKHGLEYFETSALTNTGVQEIFENLARKIRQKQLKEDGIRGAGDEDRFQLRETLGSADGISSKSLTCCGFQITRAATLSSGTSLATPQSQVPTLRTSRTMRKSKIEVPQSSESDLAGSQAPASSPRYRIVQKSPIYVTAGAEASEGHITKGSDHPAASNNSHLRISAGTLTGLIAESANGNGERPRRSIRAPDNTVLRLSSHMKVSHDFGKRVSKVITTNDISPKG